MRIIWRRIVKNEEGIVLYCSRVHIGNEEDVVDKSIISTFVQRNNNSTAGQQYNRRIIVAELRTNFFAFLHHLLFRISDAQMKHVPVFSPQEYLEFQCMNMSPIDAALYSLSMGNVEFDDLGSSHCIVLGDLPRGYSL